MSVVFVDRLHDRKLCVLGMCTLLSMSPHRPVVLNECVQQIIPSLIVLFEGLKRAYAGTSLYYKCYLVKIKVFSESLMLGVLLSCGIINQN